MSEEITDIASYKRITGAKRFKRTASEMNRGLSPEEALQERLTTEQDDGPNSKKIGDNVPKAQDRDKHNTKGPRPSTSRKGNITLRLRPEAGVDKGFFERVPSGAVDLVLDEGWYGFFDRLAEHPYDGDVQKLMQHILDFGIGEVGTRMQFAEDIEEYERPVRHSTSI